MIEQINSTAIWETASVVISSHSTLTWLSRLRPRSWSRCFLEGGSALLRSLPTCTHLMALQSCCLYQSCRPPSPQPGHEEPGKLRGSPEAGVFPQEARQHLGYGILRFSQKGSCSSVPMALVVVAQVTSLFPGDSHHFGLHPLCLCVALSAAAHEDSDPATLCLASQAFFWKLGGSLHDPLGPTSCFLAEPRG